MQKQGTYAEKGYRPVRKQRHELADAAACPIEAALDVMGGKWKAVLLYRLADGPVRFNTLHRQLCRISARTLTQQLRELEADGLVLRTVYHEVPPRVEYALTEPGRTLLPALDALRRWSEQHIFAETTSPASQGSGDPANRNQSPETSH
jgi:DNA-binding HxlR family transcriptional regulator